MKVSIIIKAYNEEKTIAKSIESSLDAIKGIGGEVIVVDSLSADKTLRIAKTYPVVVVQINKNSIKTAALALEVGYRASKGEYVYVLDGDMILEKNFIKKVLPLFKDKRVAGVGGIIREPHAGNFLSERAQRYYNKIQVGEVNYLDGGGLYRRSAIEGIGHLANPYLFSAEESELGFELKKHNYRLIRTNISSVVHYFDEDKTSSILIKNWKTGYMYGFGQVLRLSFKSGYFFRYLIKLRIYIATLLWFMLLLVSIFSLIFTKWVFFIYSLFTFAALIILLIKKRSLKDLLFSIFIWNLRSIGIIIGFTMGAKNAEKYKLPYSIVKIIKKY